MNHACDANTRSHYDRSPELTRVTVQATRDIAAGEALTLAYVPGDMRLVKRRALLRQRYLFDCECAKCRREMELKARGRRGAIVLFCVLAALLAPYTARR
jgi:SET domain-containing protein